VEAKQRLKRPRDRGQIVRPTRRDSEHPRLTELVSEPLLQEELLVLAVEDEPIVGRGR
jgi:hypothetical protein